MTNQHVIKREMIEQRKLIDIYYDSGDKLRTIQLNREERFIKDFSDNQMDIIVIEIIPKDNILKDYFLLPLIDYTNNYNKLISKDIAIIQYPHGNLNYSYGKIIRVTKMAEFAHDAGID